MKLEEYFKEQLNRLVEESSQTLKEVAANLYCEYLPHIEGDVEGNVTWRTQACLRSILNGKYRLEGGYLVVMDDNQIDIRLRWDCEHTGISRALFNQFKDEIVNTEIELLRKEIEFLKSQRKYY